MMDKRDLHHCHHNSGFYGRCNTWYRQRVDYWTAYFEIANFMCNERTIEIMAMMRTGNPIPTAPATMMQGYLDAMGGREPQNEETLLIRQGTTSQSSFKKVRHKHLLGRLKAQTIPRQQARKLSVKDDWIRQGLIEADPIHLPYLVSRGVGEGCRVDFYSWQPHPNVQCPKFKANFGQSGERIRDSLIIPIKSPRGEIIGMETRVVKDDGSKVVHQYRTLNAQWNPYALGAEEGFKALWDQGDLWVVRGSSTRLLLIRSYLDVMQSSVH